MTKSKRGMIFFCFHKNESESNESNANRMNRDES
jgi:hypothetical protein